VVVVEDFEEVLEVIVVDGVVDLVVDGAVGVVKAAIAVVVVAVVAVAGAVEVVEHAVVVEERTVTRTGCR